MGSVVKCVGFGLTFSLLIGTLSQTAAIQPCYGFGFGTSAIDHQKIDPELDKIDIELAKEDREIAQSLIKDFASSMRQEGFTVEHEDSMVSGFLKYLQDRRQRQKNITVEELHILIFSRSPHPQQSKFSSPPSKTWLESFGSSGAMDFDSHSEDHIHLIEALDRIGKIPTLPPGSNISTRIGKRGTRSLVKRFQFDNEDVFFKRPSPLLVTPHSESAFMRTLCEAVAYRISSLLDLDIVERTQFARDGEYIGSTRDTISVEDGRFQYERPDSLSDRDLESIDSPWLPGISRLRVVDFVLGGYDRHEGNMLYDPIRHLIKGIDYEEDLTGIAGSLKTHLISGGRFPVKYDPLLKQKLLRVTYEMLRSSVEDIAIDQEIENLWLKILILRADMTQSHS